MILAIDPGKHQIGWAITKRTSLYKCGLYPFDKLSDLYHWVKACNPDVLVVEVPRVYKNRTPRPNDIVDLGLVAGACIAAGNNKIIKVYPNEWTNRVKKEIRQPRLLKRLSPGELALIPKQDHNIIDAIGLLKYITD